MEDDKPSEEVVYEFTEEYSGLRIVVMLSLLINKEGRNVRLLALYSTANIEEMFIALTPYYIGLFVFQIILVSLLMGVYVKWFTKPLLQLNERAKEIASLSFDEPLELSREDELGELSKNLEIISTNLSSKILELEDSESYIRNLLNNLSHEFKTPLGIMSGFIEVLQDGLEKEAPAYYYDALAEEVERLNKLVVEAIELSRLETRHLPIVLEEVKMSSLVSETLNKLRLFSEDKDQNLKITLDEAIILGNRDKLEQLWMNILINAIRYSPKGALIEVAVLDKGNCIEAYVENYGVHIEEESLEKIWTPFYRGENQEVEKQVEMVWD